MPSRNRSLINSLYDARERAGYSMSDMAQLCGATYSSYRNWEHGIGCPNPDAWKILEETLGKPAMRSFSIDTSGPQWKLYHEIKDLKLAESYPTPKTLKDARTSILSTSQQRMCLILNISNMTYYNWESGRSRITMPFKELLEDLFGPMI